MTTVTTPIQNEEIDGGPRESNMVLQVTAILFFGLNLAVAAVLMLLPFRKFFYGRFQQVPETVLWLLFAFTLTFAILIYTLGATRNSRRKYSNLGGTTYLALGLLCAVEIFILAGGSFPTSFWWLFPVLTLLGAIGVYLPERAKRLKKAAEEIKAAEAVLRERRKSPIVLRLKARRYYVYENKLFVYTD